jgi:hypothetical protein
MRTKKNSADKRTGHIHIRFRPSELGTVLRVAQEEHEYPSTYLRRVVLKHFDHLGFGEATNEVTATKEVQVS